METGGEGSFQAVKLQRPARAAVCSHSTKDMAAMRSIKSRLDPKTMLSVSVYPVGNTSKVGAKTSVPTPRPIPM